MGFWGDLYTRLRDFGYTSRRVGRESALNFIFICASTVQFSRSGGRVSPRISTLGGGAFGMHTSVSVE